MFATWIPSVPAEYVSGLETVAAATAPLFAYRRPERLPTVSDGVVSAPVDAMVVEPVWPKAAVFAVRRPLKRFVDVAFASVVFPETVSAVSVPTLVRDEAVTPDASVEPVSVPAGAMTATEPAAVMRPFAFTVKVGIAVEPPKEPTLLLTVASVAAAEPGPDAVMSPVSAVM